MSQGGPQAFGNQNGIVAINLGEHEQELVAAQSSHAVVSPRLLAQRESNSTQHLITRQVPTAIVDSLEAITVEQSDGK